MKKVLSLFMFLLLLFSLYSCKNSDSKYSTNNNSKSKYSTSKNSTNKISSSLNTKSNIEIEMDRIYNLIPTSFNDDTPLPSSDTYDIKYYIEDIDIGNTIKFEIYNETTGVIYYGPKTIDLKIVLTKDNESLTKIKTINRKTNKDKYVEYITNELNNCIDEYISNFPVSISTDFILPTFESTNDIISKININTKLKETNGTYVYNYPTTSSVFSIDIELTEDEITVNKKIDIPVLSISEKNSVPKIYLYVDGKITKNEYLNGTFTLETKDENGEWINELSALEIKIKGRGNSTWGFDKKPYKIKFSEKISLFDEPKAKTWTLIANYIDHSLMRNYAAYYLGRNLSGLEHTTCAHYCDVYLNDEYQGNYLLCEQVEVDKNRLNINVKNDNSGFLIEMDQKYFESNTGTEGIDYFYSKLHGNNFLFAIQEPDPEDVTSTKVANIKSYLEEAIAALKANTDNMYNYFDLNSVVDSFIINEITKNKDVGYSSFYIFKDDNGKINFGPIWDYDLSSLGQGNISKDERSAIGWYSETSYKNPFYEYFLRNNTFKKAVKKRFNEIKNTLLKDFIVELENTKDYIYYSATLNFTKWDVIGKETGWWISDEEHSVKTWTGQVDLLINYYKERIEWMNTELNKW